jgi:CRP/FNR family transcriptional regulator
LGFKFVSRFIIFCKYVHTRLIEFFKDWASKEGTNSNNKIVLKKYLTQQDIANLICIKRQSAAALYKDLKQKEDFV